jgi:type I restriction enzyme S subunit
VGGGTPSKANPLFWTDGTIPWVSAKDIKTPVITKTVDSITEDAVRNSAAKRVPAGSVLCVMRSGILAHSFPVAVNEVEVTINQDLRALVVRDDVSAEYVAHYLRFSGSNILRTCAKHGTTVASIEAQRLNRVLVPLPEIDMQRRIAARIDELFDEIDDGEEELRRARQQLETYRKSLLKAAVTGELSADWRSANSPKETGEQLLKRILQERREHWAAEPGNGSKRYKESVSPAGDLPFEKPGGWSCASLGQLGDIVTGATPPSSRSECFGDLAPFFTPGDLEASFVTAARRSLSSTGLEVVRPVPAGSILVTCIGATIGKLAMSGAGGATNQQINAIVPFVSCLGPWIHTWLRSPFGQHEIIERASSTTMPILNKGDFSRIPIPLPSLAEAAAIGAELDRDWLGASDLMDGLAGPASAAGELRQSVLAAAFRGELI